MAERERASIAATAEDESPGVGLEEKWGPAAFVCGSCIANLMRWVVICNMVASLETNVFGSSERFYHWWARERAKGLMDCMFTYLCPKFDVF